MAEVLVSLIVDKRIEQHVLLYAGGVDEAISGLIRERFKPIVKGRKRRRTIPATEKLGGAVFEWEGEFHLIDRVGDKYNTLERRRTYPNREAAEMIAIHSG